MKNILLFIELFLLLFPIQSIGNINNGKLVVCLASKGELFDERDSDVDGVMGLGELAHKYGFPVTFYLKSFTAKRAAEILKNGYEKYGDEVGWYAEGVDISLAENDLDELQQIIYWDKIRSAAQLHYGKEWVNFFSENRIESVWGRCYEQTATDGITDRGCPFGFYYLNPDCFKVPNRKNGGVISVPWLSNDVNLVYHTAQQSTFTFDVNDPQDIGLFRNNLYDEAFWDAEITEYIKQTKYNKIVPLVIQQEIGEFIFSGENEWRLKMKEDGKKILESLFIVLKKRNIDVVTVSEAVDMYKKVYPKSTQPTYAIFENVASKIDGIDSLKTLVPVEERFSHENIEKYKSYGTSFNGYFATGRVDREWYYYSPKKVKLSEFPKTLTYYDKNGLLVFECGNSTPSRITPYSQLPDDAHVTAILPEMSKWFDTQKCIPKADIDISEHNGILEISITVEYHIDPLFKIPTLPYGVMLWGKYYNKYDFNSEMPVGAKLLEDEGLFIPLVLNTGINKFNYKLKVL